MMSLVDQIRWFTRARIFLVFLGAIVFSSLSLPAEENMPGGAYITALATNPLKPDALYAATNGTGIYRRESREAPWEEITPDPERKKWYALAWIPGDPGVLLAGGENTGLYLSRDGGDQWIQVARDTTLTILDIALHPDDPESAYFLTPGGVWFTPDFKDMGSWEQAFNYAHWLEVNPQPDWPDEAWEFNRFQKITVDPHHPETVLIGARWEGGFHRSDDAGATWSHQPINGIFRRADELRVDPLKPDRYYAFTHHQGLFTSYNRGQSWVASGRGLRPQIRNPHYGVYLLGGVAIHPSIPGLMLSGSDDSTWKSTDHGESWIEVGKTLTCEFVRATAFHPENPDILYAGSNVGIYQSTDGGKTWDPANRGFPGKTVQKTLDITIGGKAFRYALVQGRPAVYRRPLDGDAEYRPMGWKLYTAGSDLDFDPSTETLTLTTPGGEAITSSDGGFRWSLPETVFAERSLYSPDIFISPIEGGPNLAIVNAAVPDPSPLLHYYKRPPFVAIQLVGPNYPEDGSLPLWSTHWEDHLVGTVDIPESAVRRDSRLYIEVRDFQDGTRAGYAPYLGRDRTSVVTVSPITNAPVNKPSCPFCSHTGN